MLHLQPPHPTPPLPHFSLSNDLPFPQEGLCVFLQARLPNAWVSTADVVSHRGLVNIYHYLREVYPADVQPTHDRVLVGKHHHSSPSVDAGRIVEWSWEDKICKRAVEVLLGVYGAEIATAYLHEVECRKPRFDGSPSRMGSFEYDAKLGKDVAVSTGEGGGGCSSSVADVGGDGGDDGGGDGGWSEYGGAVYITGGLGTSLLPFLTHPESSFRAGFQRRTQQAGCRNRVRVTRRVRMSLFLEAEVLWRVVWCDCSMNAVVCGTEAWLMFPCYCRFLCVF